MNIVVKKEADIQGLSANREKTDNGIMKLSYDNGNWVGTYDPVKKVVLGGVSIDGETFDNDFKITKVKKDNAMDTLKYCAGLFVEYDKITMSFNELKNTYEELCSTEALIQSCEE